MSHHVRTCASCQEDEKILRGLFAAMDDLPQVEPPMFFADNVMARVKREQAAGPWWQRLVSQLPNFGRTSVGIGLASAAAVALVWSLNYRPAGEVPTTQSANMMPDISGLNAAGRPLPHLKAEESHKISDGNFFAFRFEVENADSASIQVIVPGAEKDSYSFAVRDGQKTPPMYIPVSLAGQEKNLALTVNWQPVGEAKGGIHTRAIVVPTPDAGNAADERLTLDLPTMRLADAVRQMAGYYGAAVAMEDIPLAQDVHLTARNETFAQALTRQLEPLGLKVSASAAGVAIQKAGGVTPTVAERPISSAEGVPAR